MIVRCKQCGNDFDTDKKQTILVTVLGKNGESNQPMVHICGWRCLTEWSEDHECTESPDRKLTERLPDFRTSIDDDGVVHVAGKTL